MDPDFQKDQGVSEILFQIFENIVWILPILISELQIDCSQAQKELSVPTTVGSREEGDSRFGEVGQNVWDFRFFAPGSSVTRGNHWKPSPIDVL